MRIDELIKQLEEIKKRNGNIECVQETVDFFEKKIDSTVENVKVVNFNNGKAAKLDWRT